ncbi:probable C-mannosyltransferase DPY19L3 [Pteropus vampyrus]|uniref:Probable C-mannosyltransferase DPY19L3 n=1 Tax=Pteropus vampyrus TaxID=132908 RepID=A0A6P6BTP5_PTEVA|nr:probable C-mannosyltransferase DPY19L3 [Pteropus vampyrus]
MISIRQRKGVKTTEVSEDHAAQEENVKLENKLLSGCSSTRLWKTLSFTVGGTIALCVGLLTSVYLATLHENDLWFSNIKEVEREISFRTECGLYYSYYKQMLQAPTLTEGFHGLMYDNKTESMRTINLLQRMNIYQEVFLSILYRVLPIQKYLEPVYFYIYTLFGLQAIYVTALYTTSWLLSGTWLSGLLAAVWYVTNRTDTTRVEFTVPLRENWALPFFAIQVAAVTYFLRPNLRPRSERLTLLTIFVSTFLFSLAWQFNQFVMLVQALVLFSLDSLDMLPASKVAWLYGMQVAGLLLVCALQFFNSMILGSLLISFNLAVLIARKLQKNLKTGNFLNRLGKLLLHVFVVLCLTLFLNNVIKKILNLKSDEHIFKFLKAKFGFGATRDFDANLYLCEEAFGLLPLNTLERLADTLLFYIYVFVLCVTAAAALAVAFHNLSDPIGRSVGNVARRTLSLKPETAYNLMHTILFGFLALSTMRMKYLWTSHMCVFASSGVCSAELWELLLKLIHLYNPKRIWVLRYSVPVLVLLYLCYKVRHFPRLVPVSGLCRRRVTLTRCALCVTGNWVLAATFVGRLDTREQVQPRRAVLSVVRSCLGLDPRSAVNSGFIICFAPGSPCVRFTKSHSGSLHCVFVALWDESQEGVGFSQQDRLKGHPLGQPWRAVRRLPAAGKGLRRVCAGHFLPARPSLDQTPAPVASWLWGLRGLTGTLNSSSSHTPGKAVFAGSMQLLAGVKLCTGRALTNHPHYEDSGLRERTRAVYQIYAKRPPEEVHTLLRALGADYVILEDSICYERRHPRGCRLRDLLDVANGHVMDGPGENDPDLKPADHPRFCEEIRRDLPPYRAFFTRVFQNKTFHVYRLSRNK